jgi:hypothetical protein
MGKDGVNLLCAGSPQGVGGASQGEAGTGHVIDDQGNPIFDLS